MKKEQKRLKRKAKRKEKCKLISQITEASDSDLKAGEELQKEENCTNGNVGVTEELNGHRDSWGDDEDEVNSNGSPCSCDDLNNSEIKHWSPELHHGAACSHFEDPCRIGAEEDNKCADCLSSGHSSEGSLSGKGKTTMSKPKEKKKRVEGIDDEEERLLKLMGWKEGGAGSQDCSSSEEDLCISEQDILRFKANQKSVLQQRRKLREKLRQNFNDMALKDALNFGVVH
ncbi:hypothetical protein P5673_019457 [Acropora cervicornis]|uniref:Uncharacterized protein n=1 Tax=Acropora cervicornis TaxID=6130 RepID=A0AAD9QBL0_ACRCE|nr:hypothetical protein P5673_019457 [Acropora cervicornis]